MPVKKDEYSTFIKEEQLPLNDAAPANEPKKFGTNRDVSNSVSPKITAHHQQNGTEMNFQINQIPNNVTQSQSTVQQMMNKTVNLQKDKSPFSTMAD
jgi:hypothetical protein